MFKANFIFVATSVLTLMVAGLQQSHGNDALTLKQAMTKGAENSGYLHQQNQAPGNEAPKADLESFQTTIGPLLQEACSNCHGADKQKADFRVDTLNPDLLHGGDVDWWLEVMEVISNGEMPPEDADEQLSDEGKTAVIDWLSTEIHVASQVARSEKGHSSFRRLTRYEYNYALQDLLGLPYDFASDLPPEAASEDGFQNSSELLQISASQLQTYRGLAKQALKKATVQGDRPKPFHYGLTMETLSEKKWRDFEKQLNKLRDVHQDDRDKLKQAMDKALAKNKPNESSQAHFKKLPAGDAIKFSWGYGGAKGAPLPTETLPKIPIELPTVAILPAKQSITIDVRDTLPDSGNLRVRILASQLEQQSEIPPAIRLYFGHQASNNSKAEQAVENLDIKITAAPGKPEFYQWNIPLSEVIRNPYRGVTELGKRPNPAEYIKFVNSSLNNKASAIQIDYVEITANAFEHWPPESHRQIFINSENRSNETVYAREILTNFMPRAWRRPISDSEVNKKMVLFDKIRPVTENFHDTMIEVIAGILSAPDFLYLVKGEKKPTDHELATRLSMFLWCSVPDQELLDLATAGKLSNSDTLTHQTRRLLTDPKSRRFTKHFVHQWLGMQLLEYLKVDKKTYGRQFDEDLRQAMQQEPVKLFEEILSNNHSIMDFLHADYIMINERLARHYKINDIYGTEFQKVSLKPDMPRGGLLTQAGLLAMNSDGKDSHPLKRSIWLLENLLHDPPPPPPPAVPEIDLTDPNILKLTLKERMEDHRDDPACSSCHAKIDPWGIALENYDALGNWRDKIRNTPVDANSILFNQQKLEGMHGLKRFLLENRQDQFARAMVYKLTAYALGRPLSFSDRAEIEAITGKLRQQDDGLATLITLIVTSELFKIQ